MIHFVKVPQCDLNVALFISLCVWEVHIIRFKLYTGLLRLPLAVGRQQRTIDIYIHNEAVLCRLS